MAIDMDIDVGKIIKDLFAKNNSQGDGNNKKPNDPFTKVIVAGVVAFLVVTSYLFFIYFPTQEENSIKEQKISQVNDLKGCITELSENIVRAKKDLSTAQTKYKNLTKLFHTGQELDDLYRHISMLALTNQLMVSKIEKAGESPVFEVESVSNEVDTAMDMSLPNPDETESKNSMGAAVSICDSIQSVDSMPMNDNIPNEGEYQEQMPIEGMPGEEGSKPRKVAYYELKVEFEISGNYANYTNFRKGLAKLKKNININQEKIVVLQSETKKGEVKVETVLAIYRLPANKSEEYAEDNEQGDLL